MRPFLLPSFLSFLSLNETFFSFLLSFWLLHHRQLPISPRLCVLISQPSPIYARHIPPGPHSHPLHSAPPQLLLPYHSIPTPFPPMSAPTPYPPSPCTHPISPHITRPPSARSPPSPFYPIAPTPFLTPPSNGRPFLPHRHLQCHGETESPTPPPPRSRKVTAPEVRPSSSLPTAGDPSAAVG